MPAEWEPHASTWLAWPHFRGDWPGKFEPIPWVYAEIVRNLARHERVDLIVNSERAEKSARAVLEQADALSDNVVFHRWRTDRVWTRDSGCIFLKLIPGVSAQRTGANLGHGEAVPDQDSGSVDDQDAEPKEDESTLAPRTALPVQRLGEVRQLQARRQTRRTHGQKAADARIVQAQTFHGSSSPRSSASCSKAAPSMSTAEAR